MSQEPDATDGDAAADEGRGWRRPGWRRVLAVVVLAPLALLVLGGTVLWVSTDVPPPGAVRNPQASVLVYADGSELARTAKENRTSVGLDQVSLDAQRAVLAAEDRQFYEQSGISLRGMARAFWVNLKSGEVEQGGSRCAPG